jgi:NACalpha-BTF3-like transcription factor
MVKECKKCKEIFDIESFYKSSSNKDGRRGECKFCHKKMKKEHYINNKEVYDLQRINYRKNNKEKVLRNQRKYREETRGTQRFYSSKRRKTVKEATPKWAELDKIQTVYEKAKWLEELTGLKYHVDHIIPLTNENVCGLHCWNNLQILEASINTKKHNNF